MTETTVSASKLALGDRIGEKLIVAVGFTDVWEDGAHRLQDSYTAPDAYKETLCHRDEQVHIERQEVVPARLPGGPGQQGGGDEAHPPPAQAQTWGSCSSHHPADDDDHEGARWRGRGRRGGPRHEV